MAAHREGRAVKADSLASRRIVDGDLPVLAFCIARVHAEEHLGPILRLEPALAGVDRHDAITRIELVIEPRGKLERVGIRRELAYRIDDLSLELVVALHRKLIGRLGILEKRDGVIILGDFVTQGRGLAHDALRVLLVIPKPRLCRLRL